MKVFCFFCQPEVVAKYTALLVDYDLEFITTVPGASLFGYVSNSEFEPRVFLADSSDSKCSELLRVTKAQREKFDLLYTVAIVHEGQSLSLDKDDILRADDMLFDSLSDAEIVLRFAKAKSSLAERVKMKNKLTFDPVSGALNEDAMRTSFYEQYELAKREAKSFTLLAMEAKIELFGDASTSGSEDNKFARDVVAIMRTKLRKYDLISRFENNYYLAMLPNAGARAANIISVRLKKELKHSLRCSTNMALAVWTPGQLMAPDLILSETINQLEVVKKLGPDNTVYVDWWI